MASLSLSGPTQIGQSNVGNNLTGGTGEIYKDTVGSVLNFRTLESTDSSVTITTNTNTIDLTVAGGGASTIGQLTNVQSSADNTTGDYVLAFNSGIPEWQPKPISSLVTDTSNGLWYDYVESFDPTPRTSIASGQLLVTSGGEFVISTFTKDGVDRGAYLNQMLISGATANLSHPENKNNNRSVKFTSNYTSITGGIKTDATLYGYLLSSSTCYDLFNPRQFDVDSTSFSPGNLIGWGGSSWTPIDVSILPVNLTLNTTGTSGAATFAGGNLNIPIYSNNPIPYDMIVQVSEDDTTAVATGTAQAQFRSPRSFTLTGVRASLVTTQVSGNILSVDINLNGVSILSTTLTFDNGEDTTTTATTPAVISTSAISDDSEITIDVDQIGDGTATGLKVYLIGEI
jgi:hypothetical protein